MNLQESILRIKSMMGLQESKMESIQSLINNSLKSFKKACDTPYSEDESINGSICEWMETGVKVNVREVFKSDDYTLIYVDLIYWSHIRYIDEDPLLWGLQDKLKLWIGKNKIIASDYTNTYPEEKRQW
jgi:hypothetical protein